MPTSQEESSASSNGSNMPASATSSTTNSSSTDSSTLSSANTQIGSSSSSTSADPVLHRLKELEESNVQNTKTLERMKKELSEREDKIKLLSADKRKEMESILATAIDNWLNSLSGVSEENRSNFRHGISKLAEHADMNNAAWEIVCNASALHNTNVKRIEELLSEAKDKDRELGELKGFRSEASRISSSSTIHNTKRARFDEEAIPSSSSSQIHHTHNNHSTGHHNNNSHSLMEPLQEIPSGPGSAWDMFQGMISRDFRSSYF